VAETQEEPLPASDWRLKCIGMGKSDIANINEIAAKTLRSRSRRI
jgi:hypothetical protein